MIKRSAAERPDMQDFIQEHRWIIEPRAEYMKSETSLDKLLMEEYKLSASITAEGRKRGLRVTERVELRADQAFNKN